MSQLSRLIEDARKTRRVNDIFNFQPVAAVTRGSQPSAAGGSQPSVESLLGSLAELESMLFCEPSLTAALPLDELTSELENIARAL